MGLIVCVLYTGASMIKAWGIFTQLRRGEIITNTITGPRRWLLGIGGVMTILYVFVGDFLMVGLTFS